MHYTDEPLRSSFKYTGQVSVLLILYDLHSSTTQHWCCSSRIKNGSCYTSLKETWPWPFRYMLLNFSLITSMNVSSPVFALLTALGYQWTSYGHWLHSHFNSVRSLLCFWHHLSQYSHLTTLGISGTALSWFTSYLSDRQHYISVRQAKSSTLPSLMVCLRVLFLVLYSSSSICAL